jgi:hypothetical protein
MFQPTDISGCLIWAKADDIIANNSNQLQSWTNAGTQSCTFTSVGGSDINLRVLNSLNGHTTLHLRSGGGLTTGLINDIPKTDKVTGIYLFRSNIAAQGAGEHIIFNGPYNNAGLNDIFVFTSSLQLDHIWLAHRFSTLLTPNYESEFISLNGYLQDWVIRSDVIDEGYIIFRRNGLLIGSGTFQTPLPDISSPPFNGQGTINIGSSDGTFIMSSGDIAEIILYDHRITDQQLSQVENYLKYKYFVGGVAGSPLFTNGCNTGTSGQYNLFPLFIYSEPASGQFTLYTQNAYSISSGIPLYTAGVFTQNNDITLYTQSSSRSSSSGTLYTLGDTISNSGINLYTQSASSFNDNILLYMCTASVASGQTSLYINGITTESRGMLLYLNSLQNINASKNTSLFIAVNASPGSSASGLYGSTSLYTYSASPGFNIPLFLQALPKDNQANSLPLYINQAPASIGATTTLFVNNNVAEHSGQTRLFIKGLGSLDGGSIDSDVMNLYLERWPADGFSLFINSAVTSSSIPLYIGAANTISSGVTIMMSGSPQLSSASGIDFFLQGGFSTFNDIALYTNGIPTETKNTILYTNGF